MKFLNLGFFFFFLWPDIKC